MASRQTKKKTDCVDFKQALERQGAQVALTRITRAGMDEDLLLMLLKDLPTRDTDFIFGWPKHVTVKRLDALIQRIREVRSLLEILDSTALGPDGLLASMFSGRNFASIRRTLGDLETHQTFLETVRPFV